MTETLCYGNLMFGAHLQLQETVQGTAAGRQIDTGCIQACASLDSGVPLPVRVLQVARTDIKILTDRPLRFGTRLRLAMYVNMQSVSASNNAVVHWCRPGSEGWQIGAFFTSTLPEHLLTDAWWELRNQIRYEANWRAWIRWSGTQSAEPVQLLDYSISGVRMNYAGHVQSGRTFWLYSSSVNDTRPLLEGRVQWVGESADGCSLGCYLFNEKGRELPRAFNQSSILHIEDTNQKSSADPDSLIPAAIENLDENPLS